MDLEGVTIGSARQILTIGTAGAEAAAALNIAASAPVAEVRRVFCAPDGTVIDLGELTHRGDFIRVDMDLLGQDAAAAAGPARLIDRGANGGRLSPSRRTAASSWRADPTARSVVSQGWLCANDS